MCNNADIDWYVRTPTSPYPVEPKVKTQLKLLKEEEAIQTEELEEQAGMVAKIQEEMNSANERLDRLEGGIREIRDAVKNREK